MIITEMREEDLAQVATLAHQLGYPNSLDDLIQRFETIRGLEDYALFVAKDETEKVVGYVQIHREPHTLLAGARADIAALVVDGRVRRKGYGAKLLQRAEEWARTHGLELVRLRSNIKREDAHRFYEKNGYAKVKTAFQFTKSLNKL